MQIYEFGAALPLFNVVSLTCYKTSLFL